MGVRAYDKPVHNDLLYILVDLKDDPTKTPDVFMVPSTQLHRLLEPYPKGVSLKTGKLTDVWCVICDKDASNYKDKWDLIENALT